MLRYYFPMAVRGFARHKLFSLINLVGLSVAFGCATLILAVRSATNSRMTCGFLIPRISTDSR